MIHRPMALEGRGRGRAGIRRPAARDDGQVVRPRIADERDGIAAGRRRQDAVQGRRGRGAEKRAEALAPIEVEQDDLAAIGRQPLVQGGQHGRGGHRGIHDRLEGQHRRQRTEPPRGGQPVDLDLQRRGQPVRLPRGVHGEGIVLEGVEFRLDVEPGRLGEARQEGRQGRQAGEAREGRHADHRRQRTSRCACGSDGSSIASSACFNASAPHWNSRPDGTAGPARAAGPRGRPAGWPPSSPPTPRRSAGRHGAMARHADGDRHEAMRAIGFGKVAEAVWRVVSHAGRRRPLHPAFGLQHEGPVPILRKRRGMTGLPAK